MNPLQLRNISLSVLLFISLVSTGIVPVQAVPTRAVSSAEQRSAAISVIEKELEEKRVKYGIPGLSLVIVENGKIIYSKGHGLKDLESKKPVTPDTQFAIGSATKAFTALSVLMSQEQKKLSLDDSPKKYLSYFKLKDKEADEKITLRDLLTHSSGLNRTDLAMITGKLNRKELIQVAGDATPTAGFRKAFLYQNIMYAAAGEVVASVQKKSWEDFVRRDILPVLGMKNSTLTTAEMAKTKDYSFGYDYNFETKTNRKLPFRDILEVAPAGSINSSSNDMAKWLQFVLSRGVVGSKRLISEEAFGEWIEPQNSITANMSYGLGWFIEKWNGETIVHHGGNIDGFNSLVAMIPEKKLGFVLLTNVTSSPIGTEMMSIIFKQLLGQGSAKAVPPSNSPIPDVDPAKEVGSYFLKEAGFNIDISFSDGSLRMTVPGQPTYELKKVAPRKYKLEGAPDGFFMTFKDDSAFLEQPQGNFTLTKIIEKPAEKPADGINPARELVGNYSPATGGVVISIRENDGKVAMTVPGQPPYELLKREGDRFYSRGLPDSYGVRAERDSMGKVIAITLMQPNGDFRLDKVNEGAERGTPSAEDVVAKAIDALGGAAAWRSLNSRITEVEVDFENQGVKANGVTYSRAPYLYASKSDLFALGKKIADAFEYMNSNGGGTITSFLPPEIHGESRLAELRVEYGFYGLLDAIVGTKLSVVGSERVKNEDSWVVEFKPAVGSEYRIYFSKTTFLPLRRFSVVSSSTSTIRLPVTVDYSDYQKVDGIMTPFRTLTVSPSMGNVVTIVKKVDHNTKIPDETFFPRR